MNQSADESGLAPDGVVHERAGGFQLRFERRLLHPVEKVWAALTSPAQRAQWLAPGEIELALGGRVSLAFADGKSVIDGRVTAIEPPRLLEFTWADRDDDRGFVRWELSAEDGGTRLVLTHTIPEAARDFGLPALAGWHSLLDQLAALLDGLPRTFSREHRHALRDQYARAGAMGARRSEPPPKHRTGTEDERRNP